MYLNWRSVLGFERNCQKMRKDPILKMKNVTKLD